MRCALIISLWLAAGSPAICCDLSTIEAAENCTQHALAQGSKTFRRGRSYEKERDVTADGWNWRVSDYRVTGLDSFVVRNVVVKKDGNRLRVTYSVHWSDVIVNVRQWPRQRVPYQRKRNGNDNDVIWIRLTGTVKITGRRPEATGHILYDLSNPDKSSSKDVTRKGEGSFFAFHSSNLDRDYMDALEEANGHRTFKLGLKLISNYKIQMRAISSDVINYLNAYVIKAFKAAEK